MANKVAFLQHMIN